MKINIQKFARVARTPFCFVGILCTIVFSLSPVAFAVGNDGRADELRGSASLNGGAWESMDSAGDDLYVGFDYDEYYGTHQFNVRFTTYENTADYDYDYYDFVVRADVQYIDSITAYGSLSETALPVDVSWLNGNPQVDASTGDVSAMPRMYVFSVRVDCSTLASGDQVYMRIYGSYINDPSYDQGVSLWSVTGVYADEVVTPETSLLDKILSAVTSGFDSVVDLLDQFVNGSEEQQEQVGQIQDSMGNANNELSNAGDVLASVSKPEVDLNTFVPTKVMLGTSYLIYVECISWIWDNTLLLSMVSILAGVILISYLLHGEKG